MKKLILTLTMLVLIKLGQAQLNPIQNLNFNHWYEDYTNYYELTWDEPEISANDTLLGYNIYRNDMLWRFQEEVEVYCIPAHCGDPDFLLENPFWIKVKAVYNTTFYESDAIDSALCDGLSESIRENKLIQDINVEKKVLAKNEYILINSVLDLSFQVSLYDSQGSTIIKRKFEGVVKKQISTENLPRGVYLLVISYNNKFVTEKIIIR